MDCPSGTATASVPRAPQFHSHVCHSCTHMLPLDPTNAKNDDWRLVGSLLILVCVLLVGARGATCPQSTCELRDLNMPAHWINTSHVATHVKGTSFKVYPMRKSGAAYLDASLDLTILAIAELQPFFPRESGTCDVSDMDPAPGDSNKYTKVLKAVDWSELCCEASLEWKMLEPTVNMSFVAIKITDPKHPPFFMQVSFSVVNDSVTRTMPGSDNTLGLDYDIEYLPHASKMTIDIQNWKWAGPNETDGYSNPSYLSIYFMGRVSLQELGVAMIDDQLLRTSINVTSPMAYLALDYLKVFAVDGVDYTRSFVSQIDNPVYEVQPGVSGPNFFALTICQDGHIFPNNSYWTNMTYDPSIIALFNGPDDETPNNNNPSAKANKKRLHPAAYAVPIAFVCVVLIVIAALVFSPFKLRHFRKFFLGHSPPKAH